MKVLFLCTANSCRSQMAEGMLRAAGGSVVEVCSAGTSLKPLHPYAVRVMKEIGIDISGRRPKKLTVASALNVCLATTMETCRRPPAAGARPTACRGRGDPALIAHREEVKPWML